jgi:WD40 repeat protein
VEDLTAGGSTTQQQQQQQQQQQHKASIYTLALNTSGSVVASGSSDHMVRLWDTRSSEKVGLDILHIRGMCVCVCVCVCLCVRTCTIVRADRNVCA